MIFYVTLTLFVALAGSFTTLIFVFIAVFKSNSKNWRRSGISFASTIIVVLALILIQETILYPPNPKLDQLVLSASREAAIGEIWLGVYDDQTWQLGYTPSDIRSEGTYQLSGDTLTLFANEGTTVMNDAERTSFIIQDKSMLEIKNSGIRYLKIWQNKIKRDGQ